MFGLCLYVWWYLGRWRVVGVVKLWDGQDSRDGWYGCGDCRDGQDGRDGRDCRDGSDGWESQDGGVEGPDGQDGWDGAELPNTKPIQPSNFQAGNTDPTHLDPSWHVCSTCPVVAMYHFSQVVLVMLIITIWSISYWHHCHSCHES